MNSIITNTVKILASLSLLLTIINLTGCTENPNKKPATDQREVNETKNLLQFYFNKELKKDSVFLYERSFSNISQLCSNEIVSENKDLGLTSEELINRLQKDTLAWSESIVPYAVILHQQDLLALRNNPMKCKNNGGGYFVLSNPIFSKDYRFAIMQSAFICGDRCGEENTLLFEKQNKAWFLSGKYCSGIY